MFIMIFFAISFFLLLYLILFCLLPLPFGKVTKVLLSLLIFCGIFKTLILRFIGGSWSPELPTWFTNSFSFIQNTLLFLFLLHILITLGYKCYSLISASPAKNIWLEHYLTIIAISIFLGAYSLFIALRVPPVVEKEIEIVNLPDAWEGVKIAHISDIHISPTFTKKWLAPLVGRINSARPDLILITGDIVDGSPSDRLEDMLPFADLQAPFGVFACAGNHEYYSGFMRWQEHFANLKINMLYNERVVLRRAGAELYLAGITDPVAKHFNLAEPDLNKTLANIDKTTPVILLSHRPNIFKEISKYHHGAILQLSGHTHGGQVLGIHYLAGLLNGGYSSGLYREGKNILHLSPGSGLWAGMPIRFGVPSNIAILTLKKAKNNE